MSRLQIISITKRYMLRFTGIRRSTFIRSVTVLVGGTAVAQALTLLALPILTRLYSPSDFSVLAVYLSVLGIVSVAAGLRLDVAVPLPASDHDAANLLGLALTCAALISGILYITVLLIPDHITSLVGQPHLRPYLWLIPFNVMLASSYSALLYWSVRKRAFTKVAKAKVSRAASGVMGQAGLGWIGFAPAGLLIGQLIMDGAGALALAASVIRRDRNVLAQINLRDMRRLFREYDRFPKYSTFESLANTAGIQLPVILIASLALGPEAGFLMLAMRSMQAPMGLIGTSVAQVYLARAPEEYRAGNLGAFTAKMVGGLTKTGVGPLLLVGILATTIFPIIFGKEWVRAGEIVAWMTPWFIMQFLVSPVSMALYVTSNQRSALIIQLCGLVLRVGGVLIAAKFAPNRIVEIYALTGFIFYAVYFSAIIFYTSVEYKVLLREIRGGLRLILFWILVALAIKFFMVRIIHSIG